MSANAPIAVPSNGADWLTTAELEETLELVSRDPDAPVTDRQVGVLRRAAVAGATTGLMYGAPRVLVAAPDSALELGSVCHDDFVH